MDEEEDDLGLGDTQQEPDRNEGIALEDFEPDQHQDDPNAAFASAPEAMGGDDGISLDQFTPDSDQSGAVSLDQFRPDAKQPEGAGMAAVRSAAHGVVPAIGSLPFMGAGAQIGGAIGALGGPAAPVTVPLGMIVGGVGGAMLGGYLTGTAQEKVLDATGMNDREQRAANEQAHPYASFAGGLAPNAIAFGPGLGMRIAERLLGGGLMGGLEAGEELAREGTVDPAKLAMATGAGLAFARPNRLGRAGMEPGERAADAFLPRPRVGDGVAPPEADPAADRQAAEQNQVQNNGRTQQAPPNENVTGVGNEASAPERSERTYSKRRERALAMEPDDGVTTIGPGNEVAPDMAAALTPPHEGVPQGAAPVRPEAAVAEPTPAAPARGPEPVGQPRPAQDVPRPFDPAGDAAIEGARLQREGMARAQQNVAAQQRGEAFAPEGARFDLGGDQPAAPQRRQQRAEDNQPQGPRERDLVDRAQEQQGAWRDLGERVELREQGATPHDIDRAIELAREHMNPEDPATPRAIQALEQAKRIGGQRAATMAERFLTTFGQEQAKARPDVRRAEPVKPARQAGGERERVAASDTERPTSPPAEHRFPVKDHNGNVIAGAPNEATARRRTNSLTAAGKMMEKYGSEFDMLTRRGHNDPNAAIDHAAVRELAKKVVDEATGEGWTRYLPRQEKGKAHKEAPREALWLDEINALSKGKRKVTDAIVRDKLLRDNDETSHDLVRDQRREEGEAWADRTTRRRPNFEDVERVTGDSNAREPDAAPRKDLPYYVEHDNGVTRINPTTTRRLRDAMKELEPEYGPATQKLVRQIAALEPNVPVHSLSHAEFDKVAKEVYGHDNIKNVLAFYDPNQHSIMLRPNTPPNTVLHEAIHAITSNRMHNNPEVVKQVKDTMDSLLERDPTLRDTYENAFKNEREFLAEGMSDRSFQEALAKMKLTPEEARALDLPAQTKGKPANGFQAFVQMVRKILGLGNDHYTALEAVVKLTDTASRAPLPVQFGKRRPVAEIDAAVQQVQADVLRKVRGPMLMKVRDMDKIAQAFDRFFPSPGDNPFRKVYNAVAETRQKALDITRADEVMHHESITLRDKDPAGWRNLEEVMQMESTYQLYGDLPLNRQGFKRDQSQRAWQDPHHPEIERLVNNLSPEIAAHRDKLYDWAADRHDALSVSAARERLAALTGIEDSALARRFMENTHTEPEYKRLGSDDKAREAALKVIQDAAQISNIHGPYTPFIRTGNWAVPGLFKVVDAAKAARKLGENEFEFNSKADADAFAAKQHGGARVTSYHVDTTTGDRHSKVTTPVMRDGQAVLDPQGNPRTYEREIPYAKGDPNVKQVWKVDVERGYLSTHDTQADAKRAAEVLRDTGHFDTQDWQPKRYQPTQNATAMATAMNKNWYERNPLYQNMSEGQRKAVEQLMAENYLQSLAATRVHSSRLHRNNVAGADDNLIRNNLMYSQETANRLAHQEFEPAIEKARTAIDSEVSLKDERSAALQSGKNEFDSRLNDMKGQGYGLAAAQMGPVMHRLMSLSYQTRLATPGYTIRNLTQPGLVALPEIGGRHGFASSARAMGKAYRDISAGSILGHGLKDTGKAMAGKLDQPRTFLADILASNKLSAEDRFAIGFMRNRGHIDADAGFDVQGTLRNNENRRLDIGQEQSRVRDVAERGLTGADKALEWSENVARQLPRAAEVVNRTVTALTAFRQEMKKNGGDRVKAAEYADDVVRNTQFVYSDVTKPTWQRNPWARAAFQFKQFGKSTYEFMGRHLGNAIRSDTDPETRKASLKSLGGLFVTHTIVAGALGLPWEPVRAVLLGAKQAGLTTTDWDQVEAGVREGLTSLGNLAGFNEKTSAKISEAMTRGLPRLLGIDMSGGLGLNNMMIFGSPLDARGGSQREMDNNLQAWLFNMVVGAPGALGIQMLRGARELVGGDYAKAIEHLSPMKVISDTTRAVDQYNNGTVNARGRQTQPPYSAYEAGLRAMGLPPGREANTSEYQRQIYGQHNQTVDARSALTRNYVQATDDAAKGTAFDRAREAGITASELAAAVSQERARARRTQDGIITDRHSRPLVERYRRVYGVDEF